MHIPAILLATACVLAGCATGAERMQHAEIDRLMDRYTGTVPGASLLVIHDGVDVIRRGYGLADMEAGIEAGPATNYRLASITKQFTAAAILLLAEDGRLRLDDPARRLVLALAARRDRCDHDPYLSLYTSGLVDYEDVMPDMPDMPDGAQLLDADVLRILETQERGYFEAGSDYRYSNSGYALLALVVERASGRAFPDFLRERIFASWGCTTPWPMCRAALRANTAPTVTASREATGRAATRVRPAPCSATAAFIPRSTTWPSGMRRHWLLNAGSRRLAFTAATSTDDPDVAYGFGWRISGDSLWHSGETIGFRNVIIRYPARRLTVVLLSNR